MYYLWSKAFGVILLIRFEKMMRILIWFILLVGGFVAGSIESAEEAEEVIFNEP